MHPRYEERVERMARTNQRIRWASRVPRERIRLLYETDARGVVDEELIDDVGIALLVRCEAIRRVTERCCPECGAALHDPGQAAQVDRLVTCPQCAWQATWRQYRDSYKEKRLHGGRAYAAFQQYLHDYPECGTPQKKMLCIDRLVHAVHQSVDDVGNSPAGQNVIEGTLGEVRQFLDGLAYGDDARTSRPGIREAYEKGMQHGDAATADYVSRKRPHGSAG
jgi:hypothetical protein